VATIHQRCCCGSGPEWYRFAVCGCQTGGGGPNLSQFYVYRSSIEAWYEQKGYPPPACVVGVPDGRCARILTGSPNTAAPSGIEYAPTGPFMDSCCECCGQLVPSPGCCYAQLRTTLGGPYLSGVGFPGPTVPGSHSGPGGLWCCYSRAAGSGSFAIEYMGRDGPTGELCPKGGNTATATLAGGAVTTINTRCTRISCAVAIQCNTFTTNNAMNCGGAFIPSARFMQRILEGVHPYTYPFLPTLTTGDVEYENVASSATCNGFSCSGTARYYQTTAGVGRWLRDVVTWNGSCALTAGADCEACPEGVDWMPGPAELRAAELRGEEERVARILAMHAGLRGDPEEIAARARFGRGCAGCG
jgi:hypothetical protein